MKITIVSGKKQTAAECERGENLLGVLRKNGFMIPASCGGRGVCGKCRVEISAGDGNERSVLACETSVEEGMTVRVGEYRGGGLTDSDAEKFACDGEDGFGVAVDIGTTTVAFALCELSTGKTVEKYAVLNGQAPFGADVISRIMAAEAGHAPAMAQAVRGQIEEAVSRFSAKYSLPAVKKVAVCGNTTMLHLFCGEDVSGIGRYPFTPAFTEYRSSPGRAFGISAQEVQILPSVSAYVGGDVVAGCVASGLDEKEALLADIGTNGEMIAHAGGRLLCTSTAAGPCFEGANIECGTGGVAGAIDRVTSEGGKITYTTIGGAAPRGICGAGLVDAVALMIECGAIDETGAFAEGDKFYISDKVYISQKDIRNFQLAKSAVSSGINVLSARAGLGLCREDSLYIAGGLGFYLSGESARKVGLLPAGAGTRVIGNAALAGTQACMLSKAALGRAKKLAAEAEYIDISADHAFMDEYIENMNFPEE